MAYDFVVIGAPRAGTNWLYRSLDAHPSLHVIHEAHLFNSPDFADPLDRARKDVAPSTAFGNITPNYFVAEDVPVRIAGSLGVSTRLILCVRDPVARAFSHSRFRRQR